jgi:hypothetical protein
MNDWNNARSTGDHLRAGFGVGPQSNFANQALRNVTGQGGMRWPFAAGGIVKARPGGLDATIGEAGEDEAVLPLSKLSQLMGSGGGGHVTIQVQGLVFGTPAELAQKMHDLATLGKRQGVFSEFGKA